MNKKPLILTSVFITSFFLSLNFIPSVFFLVKKSKVKNVNEMIPTKREVGQNDLLEKFATPNLAKAYCFYDLSKGSVEFSLNSGIYYWSFSIYENDFSEIYNYIEKDNPDIEKKVLLVTTSQALKLTKRQRSSYDKIIVSTTTTGVGVIRNFIKHWNNEDIHHSLYESKCSLAKNI